MLRISEVKNGRVYSIIFAGAVTMNKGGRLGVPSNPLLDCDVTKRSVLRVQACSRASYLNRMRKVNPSYAPDSSKPSGYQATEHDCVDLNLTSGNFALRGWACGVVKNEVFVSGVPATHEQLETIAAYQSGGAFYPESKAKSSPTFMRLPLEKIEHEGWQDCIEELA